MSINSGCARAFCEGKAKCIAPENCGLYTFVRPIEADLPQHIRDRLKLTEHQKRVTGKAALMADLMVDKFFDEYKGTLENMTPRQIATVAVMRGIVAGMESMQKVYEGRK